MNQRGLARARTVADAVLYEGYLLYPYRASSAKNQSRWQFGVLGPPGAFDAGFGEPATMRLQTLLRSPADDLRLSVHVRFLQLQRRQAYDDQGRPVDAVEHEGRTTPSWDEAVEVELVETFTAAGGTRTLAVPGGRDADPPFVRQRWPVTAELSASVVRQGELATLTLTVANTGTPAADRADATRRSLIGAHLLVEAEGGAFVSVVDPPADARELAAVCSQDRCWPFLSGDPGDTDVLLGSPIILYDHPEVAPESAGALFDATEIDEILTLRVMTMTDEEKAEARATDPRAREIIDRCDQMTPQDLQQLHGIFRDPHGAPAETFATDVPWWDPAADASVDPETDSVLVGGVRVAKGSLVRVHPTRRADAQDLFFADQVARVTAVLHDVDGSTHVALVLRDDPAADLHDWYGRYFYFAPEEIEPLTDESPDISREESRP
ncbi:MAG: hypothetical protein ACXVXM_11295 [Nocardioidaceae bacterium]